MSQRRRVPAREKASRVEGDPSTFDGAASARDAERLVDVAEHCLALVRFAEGALKEDGAVDIVGIHATEESEAGGRDGVDDVGSVDAGGTTTKASVSGERRRRRENVDIPNSLNDGSRDSRSKGQFGVDDYDGRTRRGRLDGCRARSR